MVKGGKMVSFTIRRENVAIFEFKKEILRVVRCTLNYVDRG